MHCLFPFLLLRKNKVTRKNITSFTFANCQLATFDNGYRIVKTRFLFNVGGSEPTPFLDFLFLFFSDEHGLPRCFLATAPRQTVTYNFPLSDRRDIQAMRHMVGFDGGVVLSIYFPCNHRAHLHNDFYSTSIRIT